MSIAAVSLSMCIAATAGAQTLVTQSDWSGGPGEPGPVSAWGARFDQGSLVSWRSIPGQIALSSGFLQTPNRNVIVGNTNHPAGVAVGDIDGDGIDEVIVAEPLFEIFTDFGGLEWWDRDEDGNWHMQIITDALLGCLYASVADVDLDGDADIIAAQYYGPDGDLAEDGSFAWVENLAGDASAWEVHMVGERFGGARRIHAADIDGDGDIDLVGCSQLTDGFDTQQADVVWFENLDGAGDTWLQHDIELHYEGASDIHPVDIDLDGDMDLVGAASGSSGPSEFRIWENVNGDGSEWVSRQVPGAFRGAGYLDIGDIDGDGDPDIIGSGFNTGQVGFWENLDGIGETWQVWLVGSMPSGRMVELADLDGDGDLDALGCNRTSIGFDAKWVFENVSGDGQAWTQREIESHHGTRPWMVAGDIDADGRLEAIIIDEDAYSIDQYQVAWYELTRFGSSGSLTGSILDGGPSSTWGQIDWDADSPKATELSVEVRASDDPTDLGDWAMVSASGEDLSAIIDPAAQFLQYRLTFASQDGSVSPLVRDLVVDRASSCQGDLDGDGDADADDFFAYLDAFAADDLDICDIDADGDCDADDFFDYLDQFAAGC